LPPPPPPTPTGVVNASQLPQLRPDELANCETGLAKSYDNGATWSKLERITVKNSLGPMYTGGGLNHGIQLHYGPHAGRVAMARRFDCAPAGAGTKEYMRSFVLFSDDGGNNWEAGELLPEGWTECQVAEMRNGSLLMSSRLEHTFPQWQPSPDNTTWPNPDRQNKRRAFARSDDGGRTWADLWYLADRQPEIQHYTSECAHALVSAPDGTIYWGHPGGGTDGHDRSNYTMQVSHTGGATWELLDHVEPLGAGYSDAHLMPDGSLLVAFQRTFDPPVPSIEGGGYDLALARIPPMH